jgi:hypothetical protein
VARIEGRTDVLLVWHGSGAEHMIRAGVVGKLEEVLDLRDQLVFAVAGVRNL